MITVHYVHSNFALVVPKCLTFVLFLSVFFTRESSYCFQHVLAIAIPSICLSVYPSVTQVDQSKTM